MDRAIDEGYKETEIGVLPEEWEVVRLGDCLSLIRNGISKKQNATSKTGYPVTRIETISEDRINPDKVGYIDNLTPAEVEKFRLRFGDILFSHINSEPQIGRSVVYEGWPGTLLHGMNLLLLRTNSNTIPRWLNYLFMHYRVTEVFIKIAARAVNQSSINQSKMKSLLIPLPPLPEQRKIAHVLSTIQRAIELQDRVIAAVRELKKSLMCHLFTYGPVPVDQIDRVPLKETKIGLVPEHWEVVRISEHCEKPQYGYTASATTEPVGPRFLRITDIEDSGVNWTTVPFCYCSEGDVTKYRLNAGDIVVARIGATTGKSHLIAECPLSVFASYLIRIRAKPSVDSQYLYYFFNTEKYWSQINAIKESNLKKGVSASALSNLLFSLPPLPEQQGIAGVLSTLDHKIQIEEKRKSTLQSFFQTMLHLLMTGKVRVKDLEVNIDAPGR